MLKKRFVLKIIVALLIFSWCFYIISNSLQNSESSGKESSSFIEKIVSFFEEIGLGDTIITEIFESFGRKLAHMFEYFVLAILFSWEMFLFVPKKHSTFLGVITTVIFCTLFASLDEYVQTFIEGRSGSVGDVFIDSCGAYIGAFLFALIPLNRKKEKIK